MEKFSAETIVVNSGRPARADDAPVTDPVVFSSTFVGMGGDGGDQRVYGRYGNPTWDGLEKLLAQLEGAQLPAISFASGMAAIAAVVSLVKPGRKIVVPKHAYQGTIVMLKNLADAGTLELVQVDITDTDEVLAHLSGADMLFLESPTNPMLEVADLPVLIAAAKDENITTVVDNTFNTPLNLRPLELGADVVLHSVTKFLAGHSDVIVGAVVTNDQQLHQKLTYQRSIHGAIAGPMEMFLALRGMRTLALRMKASQENAMKVAHFLESHPRIGQVRYPGLESHPQHARAKATLDGFGAIMTATILPSTTSQSEGASDEELIAATEEFLGSLELFTPATSLGGVESLIERRRRHAGEPDSVPVNLVRISVGIENGDDLVQDLNQALA